MPEATGPALSHGNPRFFFKVNRRRHLHGHDLRDAVAAADNEGFAAQVDEDDLDFAAVIGVDGAGGIEHHDPVLRRETAARADLHLEARRYFKTKTRWYELALSRHENDIGVDGRGDVAAAGAGGHARGNRKVVAVGQPFDIN